MKSFLLASCLLLCLGVKAQNSFTEEKAIAIINTFFDGFHKGDTLLMRSVIAESVVMQIALSNKEGSNILRTDSIDNLMEAIGSRTVDQKWDERLLDYKVKIDGNLAHVWTPYEFWFNEVFSHCGANAFTLAKTDDGWKIIHLIDSRRKTGCNR